MLPSMLLRPDYWHRSGQVPALTTLGLDLWDFTDAINIYAISKLHIVPARTAMTIGIGADAITWRAFPAIFFWPKGEYVFIDDIIAFARKVRDRPVLIG